MTNNKAIKIAIESMNKEIKSLSVAANLQNVYDANLPSTITASKRKQELLDAMVILKEMADSYVAKYLG